MIKIRGKEKRILRIRKNIFGTQERPRFAVSKTNKHLYAQIINDDLGETLAFASTLKSDKKGKEAARLIGADIAKKAKAKKVTKVVFDRRGNKFHGRLKVVADIAREKGLDF